ncbi:MAG: substrate-binding domain-containing protein [Lachnospiraceae bacterium]|nr:substrate-binding domain-containing protein [Lachnospiraceae bacterium]
MKRILALLLTAGLMVSGLAGCSGFVSSNQTDESITDSVESDQSDESSEYQFRKDLAEKTIGISVSSLRGNYMKVFRTSLMNRMKKLGFKEQNISVYENNGDLELELKMIDLLIDSGVDQLLICPNDSADVPAITDKVVASGIPLIYFNYVPDEEERQRWVDNKWNVSCVGGDRTQVGKLQATLVASIGMDQLDMNKNGYVDYVLVEGPEDNPLSSLRRETFLAEMNEAGVPLKCLDDRHADWNRQTAFEIVQEDLDAFGKDIEVIVCQNDAMALGAMLAIQMADRIVSSDIYLAGVDCDLEAVQNIRQGTMTGSVFIDGSTQAAAVITNIMNNIDGLKNGTENYVDYVLVTAANAESVQGILEHPV